MRFSLLILLLLVSGCSKTQQKCTAQTKPGVTDDPCAGSTVSGDSRGGIADSLAISVEPWLCQGKVEPWCRQASETLFTKTYPKLDKTTCAILDDTRTREVPMEKCNIAEDDLAVLKKLFPPGMEFLSFEKGHDEANKPLYRVWYQDGFSAKSGIFDAAGKKLPEGSLLRPDDWLSPELKAILQNEAKAGSDMRVRAMLRGELSGKALLAKQNEMVQLLAPYLEPSETESLKSADAASFRFFEFRILISKLKQVLPKLKEHLQSLEKAAIACDDGYPMFCQQKADGSYGFGEPLRIETDECPIYQAPPDAVDDSFCRS